VQRCLKLPLTTSLIFLLVDDHAEMFSYNLSNLNIKSMKSSSDPVSRSYKMIVRCDMMLTSISIESS